MEIGLKDTPPLLYLPELGGVRELQSSQAEEEVQESFEDLPSHFGGS